MLKLTNQEQNAILGIIHRFAPDGKAQLLVTAEFHGAYRNAPIPGNPTEYASHYLITTLTDGHLYGNWPWNRETSNPYHYTKYGDLYKAVERHFSGAEIGEDNYGQLIIYTGLRQVSPGGDLADFISE